MKVPEATLNQYSEKPMTLRMRLRRWLFPAKHCPLPDAPCEFKDCIHLESVSVLSFADRLRVVLTGRIVVRSNIVTQNKVGNSVARSVCYVGPVGVEGIQNDSYIERESERTVV